MDLGICSPAEVKLLSQMRGDRALARASKYTPYELPIPVEN